MTPEAIAELRVLLAKAHAGTLSPAESDRYEQAFRTLEQSLNRAQLLLAPKGSKTRRSFRVVAEIPVDLSLGGARLRAQTHNFSLGGFAALLPDPPVVGTRTAFALWFVPAAPIEGEAACRAAWPEGPRWRGCFEFVGLTPEARARLQREVAEVALEMLWPSRSLGGE